ncbi:hypothetical protein [Flagellimonas marinaquae]|uniref:hypothetical protein n=1 Tax=Flagellimonas marinaquae TaxID=254955 RepID=UPI003AADC48C
MGKIFTELTDAPSDLMDGPSDLTDTIFIPITDEIITKVDRENKTIHVSTPEGLVELYLS